jgi:hypothetical protein
MERITKLEEEVTYSRLLESKSKRLWKGLKSRRLVSKEKM